MEIYCKLFDWVGTVLAATAAGTVLAAPYTVEVFHCGFNKDGVISEDAGFKVAPGLTFHAHSSTGEVG
ncbi:MAG: hypothetical protein NC221_08630 [Duncaniella sp.]|nr:hypothetical protein [Duncaniella sp.]